MWRIRVQNFVRIVPIFSEKTTTPQKNVFLRKTRLKFFPWKIVKKLYLQLISDVLGSSWNFHTIFFKHVLSKSVKKSIFQSSALSISCIFYKKLQIKIRFCYFIVRLMVLNSTIFSFLINRVRLRKYSFEKNAFKTKSDP